MSYVIINRDFWPNAAAIGEGLMCLARRLSKTGKVSVITMSIQNLSKLDSLETNEASKISFRKIKPLSNSSSSFLTRILELIYFSLWIMISLLKLNPKRIYFATNPPVLVPFLVAIYCKSLNKKYIYHVQDIHPEATSLLIRLPRFVFYALQSIDTWVLKNAYRIVTLTVDMETTLQRRGLKNNNIIILENPSTVLNLELQVKSPGVVFSGNAGRLQLMEIVLDAIEQHLKLDGQLKFCFIGAGIYKKRLIDLASRYKNFSYVGYVDGKTALKITSGYRWAILPIMPEVLSYAYPSKIPTYISAGCKIISVTGFDTSLAKWVDSTGCGENVEPSVLALTEYFNSLQAQTKHELNYYPNVSFSTPKDFAKNLYTIING